MTALQRTMRFVNNPWIISIYIILSILAFQFVDKPLAIYLHHLDLRTNLAVLKLFTKLGLWVAYVGLFLIAGLHFRYLGKNADYETKSWYLLSCILIPNLLGFAIKVTLSRARPELLFSANEFGFYWFMLKDAYWSMPSGHSLTIAALAVGLGAIVPRYFNWFLIIAMSVAISRVLLTNHYLSDVMFGFYFSLLVVGLFTQYIKRNYKILP